MIPRYQITQNEIATRQFKAVIERAKSLGKLNEVISAGKVMLEQLAVDPYQNGESRGFFPIIRIVKRVAFFSPLTVYFYIDEATRFVTILGVVLRERKK